MELENKEQSQKSKSKLIHLVLFVITLVTTTLAGAEWMYGKSAVLGEETLTLSEILSGLNYSFPFLLILTVHEFGHVFAAKYHKVKVTLPFYLPFWLGFVGIPWSLGTVGAFIRIKELIHSRKQFFDIGIAGPLAGFVVAIGVLFYGFTHLPEPEYIFAIHPEYEEYGLNYEEKVYEEQPMSVALGDNLVFWFFKEYVADPDRLPNKHELYHYPWLLAGFWALFFTAINLLPIGQLDGGHITYGLFGYKYAQIISRILFVAMVIVSGVQWVPKGAIDFDFAFHLIAYLLVLYFAFYHFEKDIKRRILIVIWVMVVQVLLAFFVPFLGQYGFYVLFAFVIGRFLSVDHPKAIEDKPLDLKRKVVGWIGLFVFIISFTPNPLQVEINEKALEKLQSPGLEVKDQHPLKIVTGRMIEIL